MVSGYDSYAAFVNGGINPAGDVTETVIGQWETVLSADAKDPKTGIALIAEKTRTYLGDIRETDGEAHAISALRSAWNSWQKANATKTGVDAAAKTLRESFTAVVTGYRAGLTYRTALAKAFDRRNETATSPHVFDAREDSIRTYESYKDIISDIQGENSYIREVGRDTVIADLKESLIALNAKRLSAYRQVRESEWDLQKAALEDEKRQFDAQLDAIYARGNTAWTKSENALRAAAESWQKAYNQSFEEKATLWNDRYVAFIERKDAWAKDLVTQAMCLGDKTILNQVPTLTEDAIREATDFIVADVIEAPDTDSLLSNIIDVDLLSGLLGSAKNLGDGVAGFTPVIFQKLKRANYTNAEILDRVREYQTREDDELQAHLAYIQYDQALETLKEAKGEIEESVNDSNDGTWKSFKNMFLDTGFKQEGDNFTKETTVGATLMDNLYETHTIKGYERYKTEIKDFTKDFALPEGLDYATIGSNGMQALLKQVMDTVPKEYNRIYGEHDKNGNLVGATYERQYMADEAYTETRVRFDNATQNYVTDLVEKTRKVNATEKSDANGYKAYLDLAESLGSSERVVVKDNGEFNVWVGYAPVMKEDADSSLDLEDWGQNVKYAGAGETGRIMGLYIQHQMIESAGKAEARQPSYNRRLWDDRGSWMAAPNLRTVTDIAMTVAAAVVAPGPGMLLVNAALNTLDDAMFTVMDIGNGMDPLAAAEGLVKKAVTNYATARINVAFAEGGGLLNAHMFGGGVIGDTLTKGLQVGMTNVASSGINSFSVSSMLDGGSLFNADSFMEGSFGKSAMAGVVAGMAGQAISGSMDKLNIGAEMSKVLGFNSMQIDQIGAFNAFAGSLAGSAVTYGMTGNTTFNLARVNGIGLLEMHVGEDGFQMNLGMNGTDVSLGTLNRAMQGVKNIEVNGKIKEAAMRDKLNDATALRVQYGFGDTAAQAQLADIIAGKAVVRDGKSLPENARGKTVNENGKRVVYLAGYHEGMTAQEQLSMGITLQHEAYRDGVADENNKTETQMATYAHTLITERMMGDQRYASLMGDLVSRDANLASDLVMLNKARENKDFGTFASYVDSTYDSSKIGRASCRERVLTDV